MGKYNKERKHGSWKDIKKAHKDFQRNAIKTRHRLKLIGGVAVYPYPYRQRIRQLMKIHCSYNKPTQEDYE